MERAVLILADLYDRLTAELCRKRNEPRWRCDECKVEFYAHDDKGDTASDPTTCVCYTCDIPLKLTG